MRTYEVAVKVPAVYAREGAGTICGYKVDAGSRGLAAKRAISLFQHEHKEKKDMVGRAMFLTIVRVN